jgi:hypothetical protein
MFSACGRAELRSCRSEVRHQRKLALGVDSPAPVKKEDRMKLRVLGGVAGALAISVALSAQGPRRDGNWEITTEMEMPGMPMKMPPMKMTQCITKEQAADPQRSLPQADGGRGGGASSCKVSDYKADGNKITWSITCEGREAMSGTGEIIYGTDAYTGSMKVVQGGQTMTMKYSGKRLGDCTR